MNESAFHAELKREHRASIRSHFGSSRDLLGLRLEPNVPTPSPLVHLGATASWERHVDGIGVVPAFGGVAGHTSEDVAASSAAKALK